MVLYFIKKQYCIGFSLLEVILSVSLVAIIGTSIVAFLGFNREGLERASTHTDAYVLAEEGMHAIRAIRDESFDNISDGTFGLLLKNNKWEFIPNSDINGEYTRSIIVNIDTPDIAEVEVHVSWNDAIGKEQEVVLNSYLTNWEVLQDIATFRITEYYISEHQLEGKDYNLTLSYDLMPNYFVIVQGSDGSGSNDGTRGPDDDYLALVKDPFGTGDLDVSIDAHSLDFSRGAFESSWVGVITVVECLQDCDKSGFTLRSVERIIHPLNRTSGADTSETSWVNSSYVVPFGGFNGAGCYTLEDKSQGHSSCNITLSVSGINKIDWTRSSISAAKSLATSTVMIVEWGSEWFIQHAIVSGSAGGDGIDVTTEYDTASLMVPVIRDSTLVWGTGWTTGQGIGEAGEAAVITLGDGVTQNPQEFNVSVGKEYPNSATFDVYTLSHPQAHIDYIWKSDGNSSALTYLFSTDEAVSPTERMSLIYNSSQGNGVGEYPRPIWSLRYQSDKKLISERRRNNGDWAAWVQGINFDAIAPMIVP
ncbi:hypothetical protein A2997_01675 [Candidatus Nomurabacteria bacterium RIFCSPLOWO2_01_FULL_36_10b]|uniref:Uncharacterized protein n=1 Tax=Candidatus Nomurabacteria bacterium RIFCSPLOWO2_01_FULL_36_10b TaxID=1801766 RepID=A0A1F6WNF5_9BACT|nr:MAG: hypothetical protein A2997_01675 [Candidatus Nomurabacteria bacterium RIFCSPLOWO2_01_FULL_36_10b]